MLAQGRPFTAHLSQRLPQSGGMVYSGSVRLNRHAVLLDMFIRLLLVASTLSISSVAFSQGADPEPSASPSASLTPVIVDESQAEKPTGKSTPTPKPDLKFPSNPIAPATPKPAETNSSEG